MARIAGVDIPKQKRGVISLTYIFGIGRTRAKEILMSAGVDDSVKVNDWSDSDISKIREAVSSFTIEGELRSETQLNIFHDAIANGFSVREVEQMVKTFAEIGYKRTSKKKTKVRKIFSLMEVAIKMCI